MEKAGDPIYRFNGGARGDPSSQTEDLGDDPVQASSLGIADLRRVAPHLLEWTTRAGEGYTDLEELYGEMIGQWARYVGHVTTLVGGVYENRKTSDQEGPVYASVPADQQRAAVRFIAGEVFAAPTWLTPEGLLERIDAAAAVRRISDRQAAVLSSLLSADRLQRLVEIETQYPGRAWVDISRSDIRPLARAQLRDTRDTRANAQRGAAAARDAMTRVHLQDIVARIDEALEPGS